jgi:ribonucleotide monophosphatase NagD (HAD superfamily)
MQTKENQAFPVVNEEENYAFPVVVNSGTDYFYGGLTKREYFAAMAMQGLLSNPNTIFETHYAVIIADALIAELNK